MRSRVVAIAVAAVLVGAAWGVRASLDRGADDDPVADGGGAVTAVCATEVADACATLAAAGRLEVAAVEPGGVTADRLTTPDGGLGAEVWVVAAPWPEIVTSARSRADLPALGVAEVSAPLATTAATTYVRPARAGALAGRCDPPGWVCLSKMADRPWTDFGGDLDWGSVAVGIPSVDRTDGLVTASVAMGDELGTADYATNDLEGPPLAWLRRLARATAARDPVADMALRPGSVDVAGGLGWPASGLPPDRVAVAAERPATVAAVVAGGGGLDLGAVADALVGSGWDRADPEGPPSTGLPEPDVMGAVRSAWKEAAP